MRVVLDTNVVVSAHIAPAGSPGEVLTRWMRREFELIVSAAILVEYEQVLRRPHIVARHQMSEADLTDVIDDFRDVATLVQVTSRLNVVAADPTDDMFVECAVDGDAAYIVTGSKHFLEVGTYQEIQIVPPEAFLILLAL